MIERKQQIQESERNIKRLGSFVEVRTRVRSVLVEKAHQATSSVEKLNLANKIIGNDAKIALDNGRIEEIATQTLSLINFEELISGPLPTQQQIEVSVPELHEVVKEQTPAKPEKHREKLTLHFRNGMEATVNKSKHAKVIEQLIKRRRTISYLTKGAFGEDTPENRDGFTKHVLSRARQLAKENQHEISRIVIEGESVYKINPKKPVESIKQDKRPTETYILFTGKEIKFTKIRFKILEKLSQGEASGKELREYSGAKNVQAAISEINEILEPEKLHIINLNKGKRGDGAYVLKSIASQEKKSGITIKQVPPERLDEAILAEKKSKTKTIEKHLKRELKPKETKDFTILGRQIKISGGKNIEVLGYMLEGFKTKPELAELTYPGIEIKVAINRIAPILFSINKQLSEQGAQLINTVSLKESHMKNAIPASYEFRTLERTEVGETLQSANEETLKRSTRTADAARVPLRETPYVPSEDEIRSEEETKVIRCVIDQLLKSEKIDFALLQRPLRTESRVRTLRHGKKQYRPYQVKDLKSLFAVGIKKMREEALVPSLREKWTEDETKTWEKVERHAARIADSDFAEYVKVVNRKLDAAEKAFVAIVRDAEGHVPAWINLN
ncbi:MAG: hypothetical protein A3B38_00605 [Candidatus Levybacteria bacterium RIFCSPLOWO2_01_FULL_36_13]|nr:MAG: hypothetical protein A2684_01845 [Candidatus Levybacteria bacterium RIFCSPHIGHO2_01_FULL_36_15b]OGH35388.1 MAG: hypothetical protein A3B38_00605 [Candidatus Levybacteria bacterium RIFCSPLOWO2_01_FULL_36_13]